MPVGIPLAMDPGRMRALQIAAAQGDPEAQAALAQMGGGGGPPPGGGGGMPPGGGGMPPAGGAMPPAGGPPPMTQSQFGNGGQPIPPDVQAQRAQQLIQLLRARGG